MWGLVALLVGLAAFFAFRWLGPRVPTGVVRRHALEKHLVASGRVMAPARIDISSLTTGLVASVAVREGQSVRAGEVLVQLDEAEARAQIAVAEAAVGQARARAQRVGRVEAVVAGAALAQAEATFSSAEQQLTRARGLFASGTISQQQLDDARRAFDVATAQRELAQAQQVGSSARGVDARDAWGALSQALGQLALARIKLTQTRLVAPQDSVVLTRTVEPGVVVTPGRALMTLAATGETRLVLQLDERDLPFVHVGMRARASADAFPDRVFDAAIAYVAPSIDLQRGTVEVRLRVSAPPAELRPDMTVSVDLEVARVPSALVVPSEAVHGLATAHPWLLVVDQHRAAKRALRLGIVGEGEVEVRGGVHEGDVVVLPDGQAIRPGQRVRPFRKEP